MTLLKLNLCCVLFSILSIFVISCGLSTEQLHEQKVKDSLHCVDSINTSKKQIEAKQKQDSITKAKEIEKVKQDSIKLIVEKEKKREVIRANEKQEYFIDQRDQHKYKVVKIGKQTWLAENLAYKASSGCWAYDNKQSNVSKYGYLYDWETAKKVAPAGWHLPSDEEWYTLENYVESKKGHEDTGNYLKSTSGWNEKGNGNDLFRFRGLPGGSRGSSGVFRGINYYGGWWSSTAYDASSVWNRSLDSDGSNSHRRNYDKACGLSVRVLRD